MKRLLYAIIATALFIQGCGKDNYDEPQSEITGRVTFNGVPLNVKGTGEAVQLKLFQPGFQLNGEVPVYVGQDGTFKIKIFDGQYKLVGRNNNGPWLNATDTLDINLSGNTEVNYEVNPYYLVENTKLSLSGDNKLSGSFSIVKNVATANMSFYTILVSKTAFVDDVSNFYRKDYDSAQGSIINVSEDLSNNATAKTATALFARIGVRATAADQAIYSEIIKIR